MTTEAAAFLDYEIDEDEAQTEGGTSMRARHHV